MEVLNERVGSMPEWCNLFKGTSENVDEDILTDDVSERIKNTYNVLDTEERARLRTQLGLTRQADVKTLKELTQGLTEVNVLDIGCNDAAWIRDRVKHLNKPCRVVGVEIDPAMSNISNVTFPEMLAICADAESDDFVNVLHKKVPDDVKFDVITLSMILLHAKDAGKILRNMRTLLKPDGYLYIRDMNDGLTVSSPDPEGIVKRMLEISERVPFTGCRHNGAEIYTMLKQCGYTRIKSVPDSVDVTLELPNVSEYDLREFLFVTNFRYVKGDTDLAYVADPTNFSEDCEYVHSNFEKLHHKFHETDYYYKMGTVVFTAQL